MSKSLISLLAVAFAGTAFAQTATTPLDSLEMDVLNPGEKPEQALERMSTKARSSGDKMVGAGQMTGLEERPTAATVSSSFGSSPLSPSERREVMPDKSDRAQDKGDRDRRDRDKDDDDDGDRKRDKDSGGKRGGDDD